MDQNHFSYTKKTVDNSVATIELELSPELAPLFIGPMKERYEIPMLQSETGTTDEGLVYLKVTLPTEDAEHIKNAFMNAFTRATGYQTSN